MNGASSLEKVVEKGKKYKLLNYFQWSPWVFHLHIKLQIYGIYMWVYIKFINNLTIIEWFSENEIYYTKSSVALYICM